MTKDILLISLLTIAPGIVLLIVQAAVKGLRTRPTTTAPLFPDFGMDAHVASVALLMAVAALSTQPGPLGSDLVIVQFFVVFAVTAMLAVTGVLHNQQRDRLCNRIGLGFFAFALSWDWIVIFWLTF